ncbi:ComEC/Rec2 family competence protein [Streptomyces sp. NPDC058755]|uniref:ComEC/Rec2 family competence protein n=1 Tax=Streptomyces sp. NPDC058755 TaxID=3346624 RepID=UPI0036974FF2
MSVQVDDIGSTESDTEKLLQAHLLDVAHGNCTLLRDAELTVVVDAARGEVLVEALEQIGNRHIHHLVLSHADKDHIAGAVALLGNSDFTVGTIWYNADGTKDTDTWEDLGYLVFELVEAGKLQAPSAINTGCGDALSLGRLGISVLHPDVQWAIRGPHRNRRTGEVRTSNTLSVVLRVSLDGTPAVLLPGDLDAPGLRRLLSLNRDLSAPVLVFPHHGGGSGEEPRVFTRELCEAVSPDVVIFSHGRSMYNNPRPEIVSQLREQVDNVRIVCTQLSKHCRDGRAAVIPSDGQTYLSSLPAAGREINASCAGSVTVTLNEDKEIAIDPPPLGHDSFIKEYAKDALCRRLLPIIPSQRA